MNVFTFAGKQQHYYRRPSFATSIMAAALCVAAHFTASAQNYDYGDAPLSYHLNSSSNAVPARHNAASSLRLGTIPDLETTPASVTSGNDNNGVNGDGADEDGTATPAALTPGSTYARSITVTNITGASAVLTGWIDFNNNGSFEPSEVQSASVANNTNGGTITLTWTALQTRDAQGGNLYMRLRIAPSLSDNAGTAVDERSLGDGLSTGVYGTALNGEVEDYRVPVTATYDFGDAPMVSYDLNSSGLNVPARHQPTATLRLGAAADLEAGPLSVAAGADNNGVNGDGADENGITTVPLMTSGSTYSVTVSVFKNQGSTATLYGWIDRNGNGRFENTSAEFTSVTLGTNPGGNTTMTLTWAAAAATGSQVYMRLRLTTGTIGDAANGTLDERAIGDGASTGAYTATILNGEVEDYRVPVTATTASGTVWADGNGNLAIDGAETGTNAGGTFVNLVDAGNNVISSAAVAANGTYSLGILPNVTGYRLVLTTAATSAVAALPGGGSIWMHTGEHVGISGSDGTADGSIALGAVGSSVTGVDFGINQRPVGPNVTMSSQPNPGSTTAAGIQPTAFNGSDGEDGSYSSNLSARTITLNPASNGTLYYNGVALTVATAITNFDPAEVAIDPAGTTSSAVSPTFTYIITDNAGVASNPVTITIPFTAATRQISGFVWNDLNLNAVKDGTEVFTNAGNIYANLVNNASDAVVSSVLVDGTAGAYTFAGANNTAYRIALSDGPQLIGSSLLGGGLPAFWASTGVNTGGTANTTNQTGVISVSSGTATLTNRDFGVAQGAASFTVCDPSMVYDQIISSYHATIARVANGNFAVWGEFTGPTSTNNSLLVPTSVTPANGFNYTGTPLLAAMGSNHEEPQSFLLTTDKLYAWGTDDLVIDPALTSNTAFQAIAPQTYPNTAATTYGLPAGVLPTDVKMMTATHGSLGILTNNGHVYILGNLSNNYGDNVTTDDARWHEVKTSASGNPALTGVVHFRMSYAGSFAVTGNNQWYTWGTRTYLGNNTGQSTRTVATPMTVPAAFTSVAAVKMIGVTSSNDNSANAGYYVLNAIDKKIYVMGENSSGNLGIGNTTDQSGWLVVRNNTNSGDLGNVKFISVQESDDNYMAASAILEDGTLWSWGDNSYNMIGGSAGVNGLHSLPITPAGFNHGSGDRAIYVEQGGHTTVLLKAGHSRYCYVGHRIEGSMGDGNDNDAQENTYNCTGTGTLTFCGATSFDAGDVPVTYENNNHATHAMTQTVSQLWMGVTTPNLNNYAFVNVAPGADNNGVSGDGTEEDGIVTLPAYARNGSYSISVVSTNNTGSNARLYAWVDWNNNGQFEAGEGRSAIVATGTVNTVITWSGLAVTGVSPQLYMRVRLTSEVLSDVAGTATYDERSVGATSNGEVEDYRIGVLPLVSGMVWDDANGSRTQDGSETATHAGGTLYVNLLNAGNAVVGSAPVAADGTYSLAVPGNETGYKLILTTSPVSTGPALPENTLWVNTGEHVNSANIALQGGALGLIELTTGTADISGQNFGIEQIPAANNVSARYINPGGTTRVTVPALNGSDFEQGTFPGTGNQDTVVINTLPAAGTLYYNGVIVNGGLQINNYNPTLLTFDPPAGGGTYTFTYSEVDAAGKLSVPATVTLDFNDLLVTGTVYNDADGGAINGIPTNVIGSNTMRANLVSATTGLVVATVPVAANGTYQFNTENGVLSNTNYTITITNTPGTAGQQPPSTVLVSAVNTAEGTTPAGDGIPNGITAIGVGTTGISNVDFGINRTPVADAKLYSVTSGAYSSTPPAGYPDINNGSNQYVTIATSSSALTGYGGLGGRLSGSDPEDCAGAASCNSTRSFQVGALNSNTQLYYDFGAGNGGIQQVVSGTVITNYDPAKLVIYGLQNSGTASNPIGFTYTLVDAAGIAGPMVSYSIMSSAPLPVTLLDFNGEATDCEVLLTWTTAEERHFDHFSVMYGIDGKSYHTIGRVKGAGGGRYEFRAGQPAGRGYYRLMIVNTDGAYTYSKVITVNTVCSDRQIAVYPNPAKQMVHISGLAAGESVQLYNIQGQLIRKQIATGNQMTMSLNDYAAGVYQIVVINPADGHKTSTRLLIAD